MLFDFWKKLPAGCNVHPDDAELMSRFGKRFELGIPPGHVNGPLKSAPVVLCFLNPRVTEVDIKYLKTTEGREMLFKQIGGEEPFPEFEPWLRWRDPLIKHVKLRQLELNRTVAVFNALPYASKNASAASETLKRSLPSVLQARQYFHDVLIPNSRRGEQFVVVCRAASVWRMDVSLVNKNLRLAPNPLGGHLGSKIGQDVTDWLSQEKDRFADAQT